MSLFHLQIKTRDNFWEFNYPYTEQYTRQPGARVSTAPQAGMSRVPFQITSLEFFIDIILPAALWSWDRLSLLKEMSTRNISWRLMRTVPRADLTTFLKSGSLNLLEPSGPVQPCTGTVALLLYKKPCYGRATNTAYQDII